MKYKLNKWNGKKIKRLREVYGLTQVEFAMLLGTARQQTISEWESEGTIPRRAYSRLLDELSQKLEKHGPIKLLRMENVTT